MELFTALGFPPTEVNKFVSKVSSICGSMNYEQLLARYRLSHENAQKVENLPGNPRQPSPQGAAPIQPPPASHMPPYCQPIPKHVYLAGQCPHPQPQPPAYHSPPGFTYVVQTSLTWQSPVSYPMAGTYFSTSQVPPPWQPSSAHQQINVTHSRNAYYQNVQGPSGCHHEANIHHVP